MFKIEVTGPNRIEIELVGKLNSAEMAIALDELIEKTREFSRGQMLYRIHDFDLPTFGAIAVELSRLPALFGLVRRFGRAAVLSDKKWIQRLSELEGHLFPGLEIKAFDVDEVAAAEAWLAR
ncbi:STAS/SEC14 domain-containing protein [Marinobacterium rhizophilum]|uniref:STAS/SEC14 domain-containing protein n=1 Tax=Marinobacterium rhizophilum TaxID=420402 RepID=A0ABY5HMV8_9GAMM|nr:STAS/SEC14 domain-containing protein [Marinobacterium rhizophilum]UTW13132.1 STAS/SEC14 domain-containing protein [Marinobacterium rhizophilum]